MKRILVAMPMEGESRRRDAARPGYKHFLLRPNLDARIGSCDVSFESPYGTIASQWTCAADGGYSWTFTVPVNTTATVVAPGSGDERDFNPGTHTVTGTQIKESVKQCTVVR